MERPFGLDLLREPDDDDEDDDELFRERLRVFLPFESLERFERLLRGLSTDEDDEEDDFLRRRDLCRRGFEGVRLSLRPPSSYDALRTFRLGGLLSCGRLFLLG